MTIKEFFGSIMKHRKMIFFLLAMSIFCCALYLDITRSSTSRVIIKYLGENASAGLSENGKEINPYEISSTTVIKNATMKLGFPNADIEQIRRNINISPIVMTSEKEKYASWIESFSDYDNTEENRANPLYYEITFTSTHGSDYTKNMLSAIINQYRSYYVDNYTYTNDVTKLSGEAVLAYDYYESIDMLSSKIDNNIAYLENIIAGDFDYHSIASGYSIHDLVDEYTSLRERKLSIAERMVIKSGVSKDSPKLINLLESKIETASRGSRLESSNAETNKKLMQVFSEKNKQYLWDDGEENSEKTEDRIETESQSSQVREDVERDEDYSNEKATYDVLILDYVGYRTNSTNLLFDKEHYERDVAAFSNGEKTPVSAKEVEEHLEFTCNRYNELHDLTKTTIADYNEYKASRSIANISGVIVESTTNAVLHYAIAIILAIILGVVISVLMDLVEEKFKEEVDFE